MVVSAARLAGDACGSVGGPGVYRRRRPDRTLAWQSVQGWLATWIVHHDEDLDAESVPTYVQRELSAYLECLNLRVWLRAGALRGL